jgi:phosphoribosylformylglycinamidine synthase
MVGLMDSVNDKMTMFFKNEGDFIYLIGNIKNDIGSSEYLHKIVGQEFSSAPYFNLDEEFDMQQLVASIIKNKLVQSAHDISEGGLVVALMESGFFNNLGFNVTQSDNNIRKDAYWFGEAQGRVVVSVSEKDNESFKAYIGKQALQVQSIGQVTKSQIVVNGEDWGNIAGWKNKYEEAIGKLMHK